MTIENVAPEGPDTLQRLRADIDMLVSCTLLTGTDEEENAAIRVKIALEGGLDALLRDAASALASDRLHQFPCGHFVSKIRRGDGSYVPIIEQEKCLPCRTIDDLRSRLYQIEELATRRSALASPPQKPDVLALVEAEIHQHLYTNTKNGNREAMFNIVKRVRQKLEPQNLDAL